MLILSLEIIATLGHIIFEVCREKQTFLTLPLYIGYNLQDLPQEVVRVQHKLYSYICLTAGYIDTIIDHTCPVLPLVFIPELTTRTPFGQPTTTRRIPSSADSDEAAFKISGALVGTVIAVFVVLL